MLTTTNIYTHAFQEANARAADAIISVLDFSKKDEKKEKSDETSKIHYQKGGSHQTVQRVKNQEKEAAERYAKTR